MEEVVSSAAEVRHRMATFISFQPEAMAQRRNNTTRIRHQQRQTYRNSSCSDMNTARSSGGKKRQQQQPEIGGNGMSPYIEPFIVTLCREKRWAEVVQRSYTHPEETIPRCAIQATNKYDHHAVKRAGVGLKFDNSSDYLHQQAAMINTSPAATVEGQQGERIFQETPLGIACASHEIHTYEVQAAIQALVNANPSQVMACQLIPGHTPLRDAIRNPRLTTNVLKILIGSEKSNTTASVSSENALTATSFCFKTALRMTDRNGMHPLDHLIIAVQLGSHPYALDLLKEIIQNSDGMAVEVGSTSSSNSVRSTASPLIRLLSLGTSFGSKGAGFEPRPSSRVLLSGGEKNNQIRLENILQATKYLLDRKLSLITWCSVMTGCSPLHVALRNYGDFAPLIREIVSRDQSGSIMTLKNHFGDLPIHVACSVGVPMVVLRMVLEHTLSASARYNKGDRTCPDPYLWSVNNSGYTPIDLEWVRHIESGKSFYSSRSFYPLEPTGVRKHCFKQDEYYQALLRDAVDQVVKQSSHSAAASKVSSKFDVASREEDAQSTFGVLIDRIKLLLSSAALRSIPADPRALLLYNACRLTSPDGPNLPLPLLELILWMHPEQLTEADPSGKLPIHYVMMQGSKLDSTPSNLQSGKVWEQFVLRLLADAPEKAKTKDASGRLPLHYLVADSSTAGFDPQTTYGSRQTVVEKLLQLHPESIDARDNVSLLDPFMLSATSRHASLDLIFLLLRHSPSRCTKSRKTKTAGDS